MYDILSLDLGGYAFRCLCESKPNARAHTHTGHPNHVALYNAVRELSSPENNQFPRHLKLWSLQVSLCLSLCPPTPPHPRPLPPLCASVSSFVRLHARVPVFVCRD
jgi:hypothetical protein